MHLERSKESLPGGVDEVVNIKGNPKTVNNALDFIHCANSINVWLHCWVAIVTSAHSPVA